MQARNDWQRKSKHRGDGADARSEHVQREPAVKRSTPEPRPTPTSKAADKSVHPTRLVRRMGSGVCRSVIVEKLVVEDGGHQPECILDIVNRVLDSNQPPLAKYTAVLLSGDFFGHLKDHFHQRIRRQLLRTVKQYARLADVLDHALVPGTEILAAVSDGKVQAQASCARHPGDLLLTGAAPYGRGRRHRFVDPASATHGFPVVLVSSRAQQADLVVLSGSRTARPGKLVRTASKHENVHEFMR